VELPGVAAWYVDRGDLDALVERSKAGAILAGGRSVANPIGTTLRPRHRAPQPKNLSMAGLSEEQV
jgi:hypothetical protein